MRCCRRCDGAAWSMSQGVAGMERSGEERVVMYCRVVG